MRMQRFLVLVFWFLLCACIPSRADQAALLSFLDKIFEAQSSDTADLWSGNTVQPSGGYLLAFQHDLTGKGSPDYFFSSTLYASSQNPVWEVFDGIDQKRNIGSNVVVPVDGFYFNSEKRQLTIYSPKGFQSGGQYLVWTANENGKLNRSSLEFKSAKEDGETIHEHAIRTIGVEIGQKVEPKIYKILLSEYLEDPDVQWRSFDYSLPIESQYLASSELALVRNSQTFTYTIAREYLSKLQKSSGNFKEGQSFSSHALNFGNPKESTLSNEALSQPNSVNDKTTKVGFSKFQIVQILIVGGFLGALVLFFLRRRI